jgi:HAD superfamily hydrolase (TIGR01509 family)
MSTPRGVLLDIDGTLVESNDAHARTRVQALAEDGIDVPFERVRRLIGMGGDKLLAEAANLRADSVQGKRISRRHRELFLKDYLPHLRPCPGARELLQKMKSRGLRLAVASSATADELEGLLKICGADELAEEKTSSDDIEQTKPDPDTVHAALRKIGLPPDEVLMLGDTPYDIEAAGRAGVGVIAVRCGGWGDADLKGPSRSTTTRRTCCATGKLSPFCHSDSVTSGNGAVRAGPGLLSRHPPQPPGRGLSCAPAILRPASVGPLPMPRPWPRQPG